ncbi:MAG: transcriptional regulator, family, partial [Actinomycetia bacterium]|nr:transcriptional regulator, family [Actinomycetes bacterium]
LERLQQLPKDKAGPLARYAATIQSQRGDYNGKVLSIRQEDLRSLAVIYDKSPAELTEELINWGVLDPEARRAVEGF